MQGLQPGLALHYKPATTAGLALPVIMCVGKIYSPVTPLSETVFDLCASSISIRSILGRGLCDAAVGQGRYGCRWGELWERPAMLRGLPVP